MRPSARQLIPAGPGPTSPHHQIHVGLQPIYDAKRRIVGCELLFRGRPASRYVIDSNAEITAEVIVSALTEFDLPALVGHRSCFFNISREFVVGELPVPVPPEQAVLELMPDFAVDPSVLAGVHRLVQQDYLVALDGCRPDDGRGELLPLARHLKIDLTGRPPDWLADTVEYYRERSSARLIAYRIERPEQLIVAEQLGFDLFQGSAVGATEIASVRTLTPAKLHRLELFGVLADPEIDFSRVAALITVDPALTLRLLRATNSAANALSHTVATVHEALVLLGVARIRQWVALLVATDVVETSVEQLTPVMVRARLCQSIADHLGMPSETAFMAGLVYGIADLLAMPIEELVDQLPLSSELVTALVDRQGAIGKVLMVAVAYERYHGYLDAVRAVPTFSLVRGYLAAVRWANHTVECLGPRPAPARV